MTEEPKGYVIERVRRALAGDERVNELALEVTVRARHVFITGTVSSPERREAVSAVVAEVLPGYEISNQTTVPRADVPVEAEELT
jgi:BON domain-containing protein